MATDTSQGKMMDQTDSLDVLRLIGKETFNALASLRLTVALLACGIFIVLVGTLAQTEHDMWDVIEMYFRAPIAWVPFQVFFPENWAPGMQNIPFGFPFPGGMAIGIAMGLNLIAAHCVRFKVRGSGIRLFSGLVITLIGGVLTWAIIAGGHDSQGLQGEPPFSWETIWGMVRVVSLLVAIGLAALGAMRLAFGRTAEAIVEFIAAALIGAFAVTAFVYPGMVNESGIRILWQLAQGGLSGVILLLGCILVFGRRGGIVLIHSGIALLMFGELWVDLQAVEEQMQITEGETINFASDTREVELAFVDTTKPDEKNSELVIPIGRIGSDGDTLDLRDVELPEDAPLALPLKIELVEYYVNSDLITKAGFNQYMAQFESTDEDDESDEDKPVAPSRHGAGIEVSDGAGQQYIAIEQTKASGADSDGRIDIAGGYFKFANSESGEDLGTLLLWQGFSLQKIPESLTINGKSYQVFLRFKRTYKPYSMKLLDFEKDDYAGTSMAKSYTSRIELHDYETDETREVKIWMNNPLRFRGETFYQSGFAGPTTTNIQIVTNSGWMIPYVSCMLVAMGMLAHFSAMMVRFVNKVIRGDYLRDTHEPTMQVSRQVRKKMQRRQAEEPEHASSGSWSLSTILTIAISTVVFLATLSYYTSKFQRARNPVEAVESMNLVGFGRLPVMYQGRFKPYDTLARNSLKIISGLETFEDDEKNKQPAILWFLDVVAGTEAAMDHRVFRIDNFEVLDLLDLKRRKGFRYSISEFEKKVPELIQQAQLAAKLEKSNKQSAYHRKVVSLARHLELYILLRDSFTEPPVHLLQSDVQRSRFVEYLRKVRADNPPLAIPDVEGVDSEDWEPYVFAWTVSGGTNKYVERFSGLLSAYRGGDVDKFNAEVNKYTGLMADNRPNDVNVEKVRFEEAFNRLAPFFTCWVMYIAIGVLAFLSFPFVLVNRSVASCMRWCVLAMVLATLFAHTGGLIGRIYISGRPPITNLYSSAVFIGWAGVAIGLFIEFITRIGVGNIISAVSGVLTLQIAKSLAADGDTFTVLVAVLDTQFWLATHVVCITLGYATTFVAGALGIISVIVLFGNWVPKKVREILYTITYGVVCFSLFFSFVGTVLGGLWADDSWGRFWGWDPKENGALIIVLWNALVLHARWCGMVRERGFAVLAIGGNIVTAWSWFGVNELSVGLHSYGFTEGALFRLGLFALLNVIMMAVGVLPVLLGFGDSRDNRQGPVLADTVD